MHPRSIIVLAVFVLVGAVAGFRQANAWTLFAPTPKRAAASPTPSTTQQPTVKSTHSAVPPTPTIRYPHSDYVVTQFPRYLTVTWMYDGSPIHVIELLCDYCASTHAWTGLPTYYYTYNNASAESIVLPGDNTYRLRVKAVSATNRESSWSAPIYIQARTNIGE